MEATYSQYSALIILVLVENKQRFLVLKLNISDSGTPRNMIYGDMSLMYYLVRQRCTPVSGEPFLYQIRVQHPHTPGYWKPRIDCVLLTGLLVIIGRCILCAVLLMGRFQLFMRLVQTKLSIVFASSVEFRWS